MKKLLVILAVFISQTITAQLDPGIILADPTKVNTLEENAIVHYTRQIEANPDDVHAIMLRSELHRALGQTASADSDLRRALAINPYARLYLNKEYRQQMFPTKSFSYVNPVAAESRGDFSKSFLLTKQYMEMINGHELDTYEAQQMDLVLSALVHHDYDDAQYLLDRVDLTSNNAALHQDVQGLLLLKRDNAKEAITYFDKAIDANPSLVTAYHNRAVAHKKMGNLDASEQDFETALAINSDIAQLYFGKGSLHELKGDVSTAMDYYRKAAANSEGYPHANTNYSTLLKSTGEYTEAIIEIDALIDDNPEVTENYYVRGGLHFIYGEYSNAVSDLELYLESNSDDSEALYYLGLSKLMNDQKLDGCTDISKSLNLGYKPSNSDLVLYMCN